ATLLATGVSRRTAVTGPMAEVVQHSLQYLRRDDIDAIVTYLRSLPPQPRPAGAVLGARHEALRQLGAAVYADQCAECHGAAGEGEPFVYPPLAGNALVTRARPTNAIRSVLLGGYPPSTAGNPRPYGMPPFAHRLDATETAA